MLLVGWIPSLITYHFSLSNARHDVRDGHDVADAHVTIAVHVGLLLRDAVRLYI